MSSRNLARTRHPEDEQWRAWVLQVPCVRCLVPAEIPCRDSKGREMTLYDWHTARKRAAGSAR